MKQLRNNISKIILASLLFPVTLTVLAFFIKNKSTNSLWQAVGDLIVFVLAYFLNQKFFKERIFWFNKNNYLAQFYTALPAIIIIALMDSTALSAPDFRVKFKVIVICLLVGLAEEYIFRGLLISLFLKVLHNNALGAVVGSSIMFGLIHLINLKSLPFGYVSSQVIFAAAVGILFGTIYIKTNNLSIVIILHALRDMFPMFSDTLVAQMSKTQFSMATLYVTAIFLLITFIIAYVQLRDFNYQN